MFLLPKAPVNHLGDIASRNSDVLEQPVVKPLERSDGPAPLPPFLHTQEKLRDG
ncbi:hypothetical protein SAZ10_14980 [Mesorhizobium sp. BAC0120]|nr:hypothetical protein [Mesorhizobium sp. BAC0120]MDW6023063.1 hypothetical protein [Mesorhizobium sp. BAC0120]